MGADRHQKLEPSAPVPAALAAASWPPRLRRTGRLPKTSTRCERPSRLSAMRRTARIDPGFAAEGGDSAEAFRIRTYSRMRNDWKRSMSVERLAGGSNRRRRRRVRPAAGTLGARGRRPAGRPGRQGPPGPARGRRGLERSASSPRHPRGTGRRCRGCGVRCRRRRKLTAPSRFEEALHGCSRARHHEVQRGSSQSGKRGDHLGFDRPVRSRSARSAPRPRSRSALCGHRRPRRRSRGRASCLSAASASGSPRTASLDGSVPMARWLLSDAGGNLAQQVGRGGHIAEDAVVVDHDLARRARRAGGGRC